MMSAAFDAGVERVVLTSSVAAIDSGHRRYDRVFGPGDWTDPDGPHVTAYTRSKTLAEREAWAIAEQRGGRDVLAVINPGTMIGPLLDDDPGTSGQIIQRLLRGDLPMLPNLILPWVDVRDVAASHAEALTSPLVGGRRTVVTNPTLSLADVARLLRDRLGPEAGKVPTRQMPGWMTILIAQFDRSLRDSRAYLGIQRRYDASSGRALLGHPFRTTERAVEEMGKSLIARRLVWT